MILLPKIRSTFFTSCYINAIIAWLYVRKPVTRERRTEHQCRSLSSKRGIIQTTMNEHSAS